MTDNAPYPVEVTRRVHAMVTAYVRKKTEDRSDIKTDFKSWTTVGEDGKSQTVVPAKYREANEKICQDVFLTLRTCRTREDLVEYFVGVICSVRQYLPQGEEFESLARALLAGDDTWEKVKALAMLTASASYV